MMEQTEIAAMVAELDGLIGLAKDQQADDAADAEGTGDRPDLWDYNVFLSVECAVHLRDMLEALSPEISDDALDAAALARPKVRALVEALGYLIRDMVAEDREDFASVTIAISALSDLGVRL